MQSKTIIFSDGASKGNPGPGGWGAIIMQKSKIKNQKEEMRVTEIGGKDKHTTNNRMELTAAINALDSLGKTKEEIVLHTDSSYVINGITGWVYGWQKKNWITSQKELVMNRDLWERLLKATSGKKIKWNYVGGHIGVAGNERVDAIASSYAEGSTPKLFSGKVTDYTIDLSNIGGNSEKKGKKTKNKAKAYSYLSLVNGIIKTHKTWEECEKRVKGIKNAKFKKSTSLEDEKEIKKDWGIKQKSISE